MSLLVFVAVDFEFEALLKGRLSRLTGHTQNGDIIDFPRLEFENPTLMR